MEQETKEKNQECESDPGNWKSMVQSFVANMISRLSDNVSEKIQNWFIKLKKRTTGAVLMALGAVFFLVGVAIYINTILENMSQWGGYVIVGGVIFVVGYFVSRD